tara:strand:- start:479 stop:883 length:405 start_codon:yes stop_codon:yes gene_type:complete
LEERELYLPKQHGPAVERLDTIDGNPVVITEYREEKGNVYSRSVKLSKILQADTFYYPNGRYYSWRVSKLCTNPTDHLYDSLVNQQYDKKGRPQSRSTSLYHEVDTAYVQYFDESGNLLPEHHRIIMTELEIKK